MRKMGINRNKNKLNNNQGKFQSSKQVNQATTSSSTRWVQSLHKRSWLTWTFLSFRTMKSTTVILLSLGLVYMVAGDLYYCSGTGWSATCSTGDTSNPDPNACYILSYGAFSGSATGGSTLCQAYELAGCTGRSLSVDRGRWSNWGFRATRVRCN